MQQTQSISLMALLGVVVGIGPLAAQTAAYQEVGPPASDTSLTWAAERTRMVQSVDQDLQSLSRADAIARGARQFIFLSSDGIFDATFPIDVVVPVERRKGHSCSDRIQKSQG